MSNLLKIQGDAYEVAVCSLLKETNDESKLWSDVPEQYLYDTGWINEYNEHRLKRKTTKTNPLQDTGVDIITKKDGEYAFIQCKNYSKVVPTEHLKGFLNTMRKFEKIKGQLYYTSSVTESARDELESLKIESIIWDPPEMFALRERLRKIRDGGKPKEKKPKKKKVLYDYQKEIVDEYSEYYKSNQKAVLGLPCGVGKTLISIHIAKRYDKVVIISPLKQFAEQNLERFLNEEDRPNLLIDSDYAGTRNIDKIKQFIDTEKRWVISTTYDSCDVISEIMRKDVFIIIDEFHDLSANNVVNVNDPIYKIINNVEDNEKMLFMSATPRIYDIEGKDDLDDESMEEMFGKNLHPMSLREAVKNGYVCDYFVSLPTMDEYDNLKKSIEDEIKIDGNLLSDDLMRRCCFLFEAIKNYGRMKCILYFRTTDEITEFMKAFAKLNEYYAYEYKSAEITHLYDQKKRREILNDFKKYDGIYLLGSVNILNECVDIPCCDTVYVTYQSKSRVRTIQRLCRAIRKLKKNPSKKAHMMIYCENVGEVTGMISSMKEFDETFVDRVRYLGLSDKLYRSDELAAKAMTNNEKYRKFLVGMKTYREEVWEQNLMLLENHATRCGKRPSRRSTNCDEVKLGNWTNRQIKIYEARLDIMKNDLFRNKWEHFVKTHRSMFLNGEEKWLHRFHQLKHFMKTHDGNMPSKSSKNAKEVELYNWVSRQKSNYDKNAQIMKNLDIRELWKGLVTEHKEELSGYEEKWKQMLVKLEAFFIKFGRRPSDKSEDEKERELGQWISDNKKKHDSREFIMSVKHENIFRMWEAFTEKYIIYLRSKEDEQDEKMINYHNFLVDPDNLKKPVAKRRPTHKTNSVLHDWYRKQVKNYNNKTGTMVDGSDAQAKFTQFLKEHWEVLKDTVVKLWQD